jgi:pyruvyl transferase EpsO
MRTIDDALRPVVARGGPAPYALLDFPDHGNVGDSAIHVGETTWMRAALQARPAYTARNEVRPDEMRSLPPETRIFLHGGGNFGDIWPSHQLFREELLELYPGRPVVQLPQSLHYDDPAAIGRTAAVIARHGAFTLLVRDRESLALATTHFDCEVVLCPDLAFAIGPLGRSAAPSVDVLLVLRSDQERAIPELSAAAMPAGWQVTDWVDEPPRVHTRARLGTGLNIARAFDLRGLQPNYRRALYFEALARARLQRGVALLSTARFVVTDRLHVHILCTLLGIPHVCLDNYYGKIRQFAAAFGTGWSGVRFVETVEEALGAAGAAHTCGVSETREING